MKAAKQPTAVARRQTVYYGLSGPYIIDASESRGGINPDDGTATPYMMESALASQIAASLPSS